MFTTTRGHTRHEGTCQIHPALKKVDFVTDDTKYDRDLARWAFQIVTTRAFPDETTGEYRIVPMADMVRA